ncbi:MerR family transcriptional regulator [Paenibacillus sp. ACRRX]|uniref:MerR family transcriptional regulator n=1 Tax=unclassified Paenibacillus TaxID=185978 RepID=UPI001EF682A2|nr:MULTISPECIES: MerR family transcriptional regulator [unclassified Paenibacillus]MCG7408282.1 MerR family transcriptional regulator [Paenibacillus sp. ACRRX]MDK8181333.1 MerR family transcriptional regulator [Paenibacillus sp. UMB4589-SE434]
MNEGKKSIGEVARILGTTIKTVRYYDMVGLLKPTSYTEGGHRLYTMNDISRLELINTLRYLEYGIEDIRKMLSGEIPFCKALDGQIEALETQVSTFRDMISILRRVKEQEHESDEDSLGYMKDLVDELIIDAERRKQFIHDKMKELKFLEGLPLEWRDTFFHFFNKYIMNEVKISAKQTHAWNELQELVNDPQYLAELKHGKLHFFTMVHQPRVNAAAWIRRMEQLRVRAEAAITLKLTANIPVVQAILADFVMLHASEEEARHKEAFFRQYAQNALHSVNERSLRVDTLCSILNPKWRLLSECNNLMLQAMEWRLKQMDEEPENIQK